MPVQVWDHDAWDRPVRRREDLEDIEWDPHQRSLMLALTYIEDRECSGCGGWLPETTSTDTDNDNPEAHYMWHADHPVRCHRCTAIARKREAYAKADQGHALSFPAMKVPRGAVQMSLIPRGEIPEIRPAPDAA